MSLPRGLLIHPEELDEIWIKRLEKSDIRTIGLHPVGGKKADESLQALYEDVRAGKYDARFRRLREMGLEIEYEMHAMSWLLPRELFAEHRDWFRMNEVGERVADFNLCPSSLGALEYVSARAAELSRVLTPTTHRYHLWIDDVRDSFCHCPACRALTPSDQALTVYNAMLKGIRTADPFAVQCYLAYQQTRVVPAAVLPAEGIFLEYAPFDRDFDRAMCDESCEKNVTEGASLPALLSFFGTKGAKVLEYWMDNSLFSKWKKPPKFFSLNKGVLRQDLAYYEKLGFADATVFACYLGRDYEDLYGAPDIEDYLKI